MIRQATLADIPYLLPFVKQFVEQKPDPFRSGLDFYARIADFFLASSDRGAPTVGFLQILDAETAWLHIFEPDQGSGLNGRLQRFLQLQIDSASRLGLKQIVTDSLPGDFPEDLPIRKLDAEERKKILQTMNEVTEFRIEVRPEQIYAIRLPQSPAAPTQPLQEPLVRDAVLQDAQGIWEIINHYALHGEMLPRSLPYIQRNIRNYSVVDWQGKVAGCAALQVVWNDLAEVASVGILEELHGRGIGRKLLDHVIQKAKRLKLPKLFALTRQVAFFERMGFRQIPKETLPPKIWKDCMHCTKFMGCDEVAVVLEI